MILTGKQILEEINQGKIEITNFNEKNLNPNSYDVTLADDIAFYITDIELDIKKDNKIQNKKITDDGYVLQPNVLYLARTNEKTITDHFAPMLEGRSSVGRLGIQIHSTAGFGDVGFNGYWTLEITVAQPVKIYPNIRIGQVYFHEIANEVADLVQRKNTDYGSSYEKTREEFDNIIFIRLTDKLNRLKQLQKEPAQVSESIEDTLKDIAGYCLLELSLLERD